MAYNLMKRIITNAKKDGVIAEKKDEIQNKLDVFLAADRLTTEQFQELVALIDA